MWEKKERVFFLWPFLNALGCSVGCFTVVLMVGFWSFFLFESSLSIFVCGMLLGGRFFLGGNACIAEVSFLFNVAITIFPESSHSLRKHRPMQSPNVDHENPWVLWVPAWFWHECSSCVIVILGSTYIKSPADLELSNFIFVNPCKSQSPPCFFFGCSWFLLQMKFSRKTAQAHIPCVFCFIPWAKADQLLPCRSDKNPQWGDFWGKKCWIFFGNVFNNTPEHHVSKK